MLCVEAITVVSTPSLTLDMTVFMMRARMVKSSINSSKQTVWGPLSFATAISTARTGSLRHPLQIIVSVAHLYGVALYYSTCFAEEYYNGISYSRPEFQYFWVYYVGFNAPWVVVPIGGCLPFPSPTQWIHRIEIADSFHSHNCV